MRATKPEESATIYERSLKGLEVLWKDAPEDLGYRGDLANTRLGYDDVSLLPKPRWEISMRAKAVVSVR